MACLLVRTVPFVVVLSLSMLMAQTPVSVPAPQPPAQAPGAQTPASQQQGTTPGPLGPRPAGAPSGGENQTFIELRYNYNFADINDKLGPDGRPAQSFLTPGNNTSLDLTVFQDQGWNSNRVQ